MRISTTRRAFAIAYIALALLTIFVHLTVAEFGPAVFSGFSKP